MAARSRVGSVFAPPSESDKCMTCTKTVYPQEQMKYDNAVWHKQCFKCQLCSSVISTASSVAKMDGNIFCRNCFKKAFKERGKYSDVLDKSTPLAIQEEDTPIVVDEAKVKADADAAAAKKQADADAAAAKKQADADAAAAKKKADEEAAAAKKQADADAAAAKQKADEEAAEAKKQADAAAAAAQKAEEEAAEAKKQADAEAAAAQAAEATKPENRLVEAKLLLAQAQLELEAAKAKKEKALAQIAEIEKELSPEATAE